MVRGVGSGVPRGGARVRRSRLRARAAVVDAAGSLPAPERPAPRLRVELRRRQPAGARVGGVVQLSSEPREPGRRGAAVPQAHVSTCWSPTSPGGSIARTATGATCSRAASSASTTSASSTAARRCRRAATWSRRTGRPGWRSTPRTCSTWRWSWRWSIPPTKTFAIKFYEHVVSIAAAINRRGERTRCGTRRTASSTTCCASRDSSRPGSRCARSSGCCRSARCRSTAPEVVAKLPGFIERVKWFNENRPELLANLNRPGRPGRPAAAT